ncbi:hypothetical protein [Bacteroides fluxus]|uniref:hypothetical protein n=1 Tax=Bacteroides fluxus TaxID=626930 RepID=UPI0023F426FC|nr:hypothetical protein [Bacteroides fluxus]
MKTIMCKHEVHQMRQETEARYELALSLVRSLMADIDEGTSQIFRETKSGMPEAEFFRGIGGLDAYGDIRWKLRQWERMLCEQAGLPMPSFDDEVAECC